MKATTVKYGGVDLPVINANDPLVPTEAIAVTLDKADKNALAIAIQSNKPALLIGETGTGKTSAIRELAYLTKRPYVRVNMTGYTTPDDLIGSKSVKDGATYYEHGIVTDAMKRGAILVLDEINATTPDCMFILHGLLDDDKRITLPNGEIITPHADFRVFATCNPDYEGTKTLNKALLDRFPIIIAVDVLTPKKEIALIIDRTTIDEKIATDLVTMATMLRADYAENKIGTYTSTRTLLHIAEFIKQGMGAKEAYTVSLVRKTQSKDEQKIMSDVYNSVLKVTDDPENEDSALQVVSKGDIKRDKARIEELEAKIFKATAEQATIKIEKLKAERESELDKDIIQQKQALLNTREKTIEEITAQLQSYKWIDTKLQSIKP